MHVCSTKRIWQKKKTPNVWAKVVRFAVSLRNADTAEDSSKQPLHGLHKMGIEAVRLGAYTANQHKRILQRHCRNKVGIPIVVLK